LERCAACAVKAVSAAQDENRTNTFTGKLAAIQEAIKCLEQLMRYRDFKFASKTMAHFMR
jgi:hypothetical protein